MHKTGYGLIAAALVLAGCHTITEELPTQPTKTKVGTGTLTIPIPAIPGATPTPTPKPTPTPAPAPAPEATPTPTPAPGQNGTCGQPLPVVTQMAGKVHIRGANMWTLDSTPLTGPDATYCRQVGFTDGRSYCPVRAEGTADRRACEEYAVGLADDTKRPGPTWYINGKLCDGTKCMNHEDNQYLLYAIAGGTYTACTKDDICVNVEVDR
jgi:hypothetical protein